MSELPLINFDLWIEIGIRSGFIGPPVCHTHDGMPTTAEEDEMWYEGDDPCIHVMRLYEDKFMQQAVEENHAPSVWRKQSFIELYDQDDVGE